MSRTKLSVLLGVVLLLSIIALALFYFMRPQETGFGCQSDTVSWKTYSTGDSTDMSLTTLFMFNSTDAITVIHKGVLRKDGKSYLIDRNYLLSVEKIDGSNIYYITDKKLNKSEDDAAPDGVVNEMLLDNINFFYITSVKRHAWLIKGLVLPVMMCVAVPTS
ncbi:MULTISPECIES: hypothetical protein [Enterobacter]|jgi:hypothetical protein|uniref:Uncharacterized protein n=1 Tax=Enterobacter cancerogenus TaxID=69218 RepID=A0A5Q2K9J3_9ENTR|nr:MULTISPECIES: hypothetical protein [Enterobacter]AUJ79586.1 hypothetical protein CWI88_00345 [Enterobacter cancerogenus]EFC54999.1 hypothetical protein ENTCAN_08172 [Enterobacter cancerogenus ATCC 35316]EKS7428037.1 hypothetical protein [Enterobacter cancerogenus]KTQ47123.1 hypothetical protein NS104_13695 [Enterobacter cancerogenus]KTQ53937.1 hypothetical protein NS111_03085 [Enterobacter cancerogenus]